MRFFKGITSGFKERFFPGKCGSWDGGSPMVTGIPIGVCGFSGMAKAIGPALRNMTRSSWMVQPSDYTENFIITPIPRSIAMWKKSPYSVTIS